MIRRLGIHVFVIPVWMFGFVTLVPIGWIVLNDVAWQAGIGGIVTQDPLAAVHHRVRGIIDTYDDASEAISYYEGHLRVMPDAPADTRAEWQRQLEHARATRTHMLIRAAIMITVAYLPIGWLIDRYFGLAALAKPWVDA